ncbi:unnamed protein product [Cyclocybe aegerita]|uniref:Replication protein A C-terminal domain-containing protein n=1 Tax=Cyclocybe aegerita TaxID=1973307 RepID=A0A8S0X9Q8_CYCAE|nr:unnamed protein product [Cyclocybe aegerita]
MKPPSNSFSSQINAPSSSQAAQNTLSNPECGVRKVTIKQLLQAVESRYGLPRFTVSGHGIGKVLLVANVYSTDVGEEIPRRITYSFDDGSGRIDGFKWEGICDPDFDPFDYACVVGELDRFDDGRKAIKIFHIRPIYDPHEVYYHIIHAIVDTLSVERGPPPRGSMASPISASHSQEADQVEKITEAVGDLAISGGRGELSSSRTQNNSKNNPPPAVSRLERDIASCISRLTAASEDDESSDDGAEIGAIIEEIKALYPDIEAKEFSSAVESLINQGIITTTIDDYHYAST